MIGSYRDKQLHSFTAGRRVKAFDGIARKLGMKLDQLDAATSLGDLNLPGDRPEALRGNRGRKFSVRVDGQWSLIFEWPKGADCPVNVEAVEHHQRSAL